MDKNINNSKGISQARDGHGRFVKTSENMQPQTELQPMSRWKRFVESEGLDVYFKIKPITAVAIALACIVFGFGVGRVSAPVVKPIVKYIRDFDPKPTIKTYQQSVFTGILQVSDNSFYTLYSESDTISLSIPSNIDLSDYLGKRLLVKGLYNSAQKLLLISNAEDIEPLPSNPQKVPTTAPSTTPTTQDEEFPSTSERNNPSM